MVSHVLDTQHECTVIRLHTTEEFIFVPVLHILRLVWFGEDEIMGQSHLIGLGLQG